MKVLSVFGTRPEAIKMAPVVRCLEKDPRIESHVCVTGQHREMLDQVLEIFEIVPDYDLDLMRYNQTLSHVTASVLTEIESILLEGRYDWVLVQGDTTTVMATSLAAFYQRVPIGHIEAGLRTYDLQKPFPEEANRRIADLLASLMFAPTEQAKQHLLEEKVPNSKIIVTGNTIVDALQYMSAYATDIPDRKIELYDDTQLVLMTAHRRENFGKPLEDICEAVRETAVAYAKQVHFVYPVHLNPNVQNVVYRELSNISNITLTEPMDYREFVYWMSKADIILTDSGGVQEEAVTLGKPLLILRESTERPEALLSGYARLLGTDKTRIKKELSQLLSATNSVSGKFYQKNVFGDGNASTKIVEALLNYA